MYSTLVTDFWDIQEAMMDRNLVMRGSGLCREEGSIWTVALVLKMSGVAEPPPESSERTPAETGLVFVNALSCLTAVPDSKSLTSTRPTVADPMTSASMACGSQNPYYSC